MKGYLKKTIKWYLKILKLSFVFKGRTRRSEYWLFHLLYIPTIILAEIILSAILLKLLAILLDQLAISLYIYIGIQLFIVLYIIIAEIAISVRRLHDIGKSGWYYLITLIPLVGAIILLVWFCQDSQPGTNRWGKNPKGIKAILYDNDVEQK